MLIYFVHEIFLFSVCRLSLSIFKHQLADLSDKNAKSKQKALINQVFRLFRYSLAQNGKHRYFLEGKRIKKAENTAFFVPFGRAISPASIFIFFLLFLTKNAFGRKRAI